MQEEASDELVGIKVHHLGLVAIGVVAPPEADVLTVEVDETVVADGGLVGVAPEIGQHPVGPARYEGHVARLDNSRGFIDLFWPVVLIVEQKSAGRDLDKAYEQAGENSTRCPSATALATYILVYVEAFGFILEPGHRPAGTASSARAPRAPAAKLLGLEEIPAIRLSDLTEGQVQA